MFRFTWSTTEYKDGEIITYRQYRDYKSSLINEVIAAWIKTFPGQNFTIMPLA